MRGHFIGDDLSSFKILSIHKGIINLLNQKTQYLLSLIKDEKNMTGMSLLVPELFNEEGNLYFEIDTDTEFQICAENGLISFSTKQKKIIIDYKNAQTWNDKPIINSDQYLSRLSEIDIFKKKLDSGNSFFAIFTGILQTPFQIKAREILNNKIEIKERNILGLEKLIGLGQGMTPSGDDFITGVLLGEYCSNTSLWVEKESIFNNIEKTTYAGRTLLFLALQGSFPAYLLTFQKEISESVKENEILKAAIKAANHGSTSGMDSLAGFYWYFQLSQTIVILE